MDLKEEDILGDNIKNHWYYAAKSNAMLDFLAQTKVEKHIDVGAGSGVFSKVLIENNVSSEAVCVDPNYHEEKTIKHENRAIHFTRSLDKDSDAKLVIMMDVLEHVEDDLALLKLYTENLEKGAKIFITVPAFQFLWSGHDVFLEHHRRYTLKEVEQLAESAGLKRIKGRYFFATFFPLLAMKRVSANYLNKKRIFEPKSELKLYPNWLNKFLFYAHKLEALTFFKVNRAFGLSVLFIGEK